MEGRKHRVIGAKFGHFLDKPLSGVAKRVGLSPNAITLFGFGVMTAAALAFSQHLVAGALLMLLGGVFDMLDGVVARNNGQTTKFGAFLDSVLDRYADAFILLGLSWFLYRSGQALGVFLALGTIPGAFMVSYTRARAEGLGKKCETGLMERPERIILIALGALSGYVMAALWVLFTLTHFTVIQRMVYVHRLLGRDEGLS